MRKLWVGLVWFCDDFFNLRLAKLTLQIKSYGLKWLAPSCLETTFFLRKMLAQNPAIQLKIMR